MKKTIALFTNHFKYIEIIVLLSLFFVLNSCKHKTESNKATIKHYFNFEISLLTHNPFFGTEFKYIITPGFDIEEHPGRIYLITYAKSLDQDKASHLVTEPKDTMSVLLQQYQADSLYILANNIIKATDTKYDHNPIPAPPLPGDGNSAVLSLKKYNRGHEVTIGNTNSDDISKLYLYLKKLSRNNTSN